MDDDYIDPFPRYTSEPGVLLSYAWAIDITQVRRPTLDDLHINDSIKLQLNYEDSKEAVWVEVRGKDRRFAWGELMDETSVIPLEKGDIIHFQPAHVLRWLNQEDYK